MGCPSSHVLPISSCVPLLYELELPSSCDISRKAAKTVTAQPQVLGFFLLREQLLLLAYCLLNLIPQRHLQSMFPLCVLILKWYLAILHTNLLRSQNYNSLIHMYIHLYFRERYMYCALMAGLCWITRNITSILDVFKKCTLGKAKDKVNLSEESWDHISWTYCHFVCITI